MSVTRNNKQLTHRKSACTPTKQRWGSSDTKKIILYHVQEKYICIKQISSNISTHQFTNLALTGAEISSGRIYCYLTWFLFLLQVVSVLRPEEMFECVFTCGADCKGTSLYPCLQIFVNNSESNSVALLHFDEQQLVLNPKVQQTCILWWWGVNALLNRCTHSFINATPGRCMCRLPMNILCLEVCSLWIDSARICFRSSVFFSETYCKLFECVCS